MTLTPKNWATFQHYKDRAPTWIKLHRALLDDYRFFCLPVASRALAPCIWLLASEYSEGKIAASIAELAFRMHLSETDLVTALKPLIDSGFIIDDSDLLADCYQPAIPEKRRDTRIDRERGEKRLGQTGQDWPPDYAEQFWRQYPRKVKKKAALRALDLVRKRDEVKFTDLMAAVARYAGADLDPQFIAHPTTWLSDGRWADDPASNAHGKRNLGNATDQANRLSDQLRARERAAGIGGTDDAVGSDQTDWADVEIIPPERH